MRLIKDAVGAKKKKKKKKKKTRVPQIYNIGMRLLTGILCLNETFVIDWS